MSRLAARTSRLSSFSSRTSSSSDTTRGGALSMSSRMSLLARLKESRTGKTDSGIRPQSYLTWRQYWCVRRTCRIASVSPTNAVNSTEYSAISNGPNFFIVHSRNLHTWKVQYIGPHSKRVEYLTRLPTQIKILNITTKC